MTTMAILIDDDCPLQPRPGPDGKPSVWHYLAEVPRRLRLRQDLDALFVQCKQLAERLAMLSLSYSLPKPCGLVQRE
jgi:hypothetical protein